MKLLAPVFLSILLMIISSCNPDDEIIDPTPGTNSITAIIDGEEFAVSGITVTANYSVINELMQTLSISRITPPFDGTTEGIVLAAVSADSTDFQAGETYVSSGVPLAGSGEYIYENGSLDIKAFSKNTDIATITITAIDYTKKIVSGTFSFDAIDEDDPTKVYEIRDGKFTNVSFE